MVFAESFVIVFIIRFVHENLLFLDFPGSNAEGFDTSDSILILTTFAYSITIEDNKGMLRI